MHAMAADPDTGPPVAPPPPQDIGAEQALLGALLQSQDAIVTALGILAGPADFYRPAHEAVYAAVLRLYERGDPIDAVTAAAALAGNSALDGAGGALYLHTLLASTPTVANAGYYARIVADTATRRRLLAAGTSIVQAAYSTTDVTAALTAAEQALGAVADHRPSDAQQRLSHIMGDALDTIEAIGSTGGVHGIGTGFLDLDELTNGLHPGQMVIVAARPATGKSTLALDFARAAAVHNGIPTAMFSLEMGDVEIAMRLLSAEARVPLHHIRTGQMTDDDWNRLARRMGEVSDAPLWIDTSSPLSMTEIRARARRLRDTEGLRLVIIDYLQLMSSGKRVENRQTEVSEFSRGCKLLAKELGVPVVALSQLNRGPEQRTDKRPLLSDLRESGSLEQDADVVLLLHRDDMYDKESPRAGEADIIVAKHRNGPTATVTVAFQGHYSRFVDMAQM